MSMVVYLRRATADEVAHLAANPDAVHEMVFSESADGRLVDFDKAWHALHFMLTGDAGKTGHPLSVLVATDEELIGTDENGFGGYWQFDPARVSAFADALAAVSDDELAQRYDPATMVREYVYLADVFEEEGEEALPYVMQGVPALRRFADEAVRDNNYVIGILS
ncbi:DUF1877 family protein [Sphingomonas suaedae]|uniref:DUF1877 family protein n=1 Tax=Sphingomonas suaedae TaxID=2599297 RepID=A0A518RFN9_9SPHN|nr:YfbM family protein [Sphingomonas suaedae]QDX26268.1 DUF1877 family protein [Sphingomonas suaedae]